MFLPVSNQMTGIREVAAWLIVVVLTLTHSGTSEARDGERAAARETAAFPESLLQQGDLIFQCGRTGYAPFLPFLLPGSKGFCHVGIVVRVEGRVRVVHVQPERRRGGGRVRLDDLDNFLDPSRTKRAALFRIADLPTGAAERASRAALKFAAEERPFDWALDRTSAARLYCTELVWRAYLDAGFSLVRDRDLMTRMWKGKRRCIITPGSVLKSGKLRLVARLVG